MQKSALDCRISLEALLPVTAEEKWNNKVQTETLKKNRKGVKLGSESTNRMCVMHTQSQQQILHKWMMDDGGNRTSAI
jgi:hypothetical protein